jgi:hypothetical protein
MRWTDPKDANRVPGAVWRAIGLDHAEHAMELPADEKDDEEMVGVPETLKVGAPLLLAGEEDHDGKGGGHDPASEAGPGGEVDIEESDNLGTACRCGRVSHRELVKVDHMGEDVHDGADDNGPGCGYVQGDILVKGDDLVKRGAAEEGDEVAADGKEDEDDIDVEDEGGRTGDGYGCLEDSYIKEEMTN